MVQVLAWKDARTTVLGSELALAAGLVGIFFGFANTGGTTALDLLVSVGGVVTAIAFSIGMLVMRNGAGPRASIGFLGIAIAIFALQAAYYVVDPATTPGSSLVALDAGLILVGDVAALFGGILLGVSLGPLTGGNGFGRASGYGFLVGGVMQMIAAVPDAGGVITNSTSLGDVGHVLDGAAGLIYVVVAPVLLYLAVRRLRKGTP